MGRFILRDGSAALAPPSDSRINWYRASDIALANGASVPSWSDRDGNANLTKQTGATVTYDDGTTNSGANGQPSVVFLFNGGGMDGTRASDSGSVLSAFYVVYNQFTSGDNDIKTAGVSGATDFTFTQTNTGAWQMAGATGAVQTGNFKTSGINIWWIILCQWNGASSKMWVSPNPSPPTAFTGTVTGTNKTGVNIGGSGTTRAWGGRVAEVIYYTTTDLGLLNGAGAYLGKRYGIGWYPAS